MPTNTPRSIAEALKPCPGCGDTRTRVIGGPGTAGGPKHWAGCDHCHWRTWGDTEAEAITAWNRRALATANGAEVGLPEAKFWKIDVSGNVPAIVLVSLPEFVRSSKRAEQLCDLLNESYGPGASYEPVYTAAQLRAAIDAALNTDRSEGSDGR